jgi:putative ABC transport system substrate-binding protein
VFEVAAPSDLVGVFTAAEDWRANGLITLADGLLFSRREQVVTWALERKLPGVYPEAEFVEAGGLASYGPSLPDLFRRSASYVDKILKGAKPADLPIEQPTKFDLVINAKTAAVLGIAIPRDLVVSADEVIE